jgi:hypothetical protein
MLQHRDEKARDRLNPAQERGHDDPARQLGGSLHDDCSLSVMIDVRSTGTAATVYLNAGR